MLLIMAFCTLIMGYSGIRHYYIRGLIQGTSTLSTFDISVLVLFGFLTGIGGNGGLAGAMNSTAKSWPDRAVSAFASVLSISCLLDPPAASYGEWHSYFRVRSVSLSILHHGSYILPWQHIRLLIGARRRHLNTDATRFLPRQAYTTAAVRNKP